MLVIQPPIRGLDSQGNGAYGAPRGSRKHKGVDIACYKGSTVMSLTVGNVTKIGYPYAPDDYKKGHLRYVQISTGDLDYRYFYIKPVVKLGDKIAIGDPIGITQGLCKIYPGITDHFHFEIKSNGNFLNPMEFL